MGRDKYVGKVKDFLNQVGLEMPLTTLEIWISQACDPTANSKPNLSINLEICDLINRHKKTYPRDAAFNIARWINFSSGHANLAIPLLDICAKNCGYPFHIVISSKEFLNELVRRFPETAKKVTATQRRILELLAEWNVIYCQRSRYKDDFKHIGDMCKLLEYKGYRIPDISEDLQPFEPQVNLKTEEQLEEEDRINQGTKLEELIRKGTPAALAEANDMMKIMSGYDVSKKPDYKEEVNSELERIESKAILLNDMLNNATASEIKAKSDRTIAELVSNTQVAQHRLQKFIEDNDDEERMIRLLEMNDLINTVLSKYDNLLNGRSIERNALDRTVAPANATVPQKDEKAVNLIDFDIEEDTPVKNPIQFDLFGNTGLNTLQFGGTTNMQYVPPMMNGPQNPYPSNLMQSGQNFQTANLDPFSMNAPQQYNNAPAGNMMYPVQGVSQMPQGSIQPANQDFSSLLFQQKANNTKNTSSDPFSNLASLGATPTAIPVNSSGLNNMANFGMGLPAIQKESLSHFPGKDTNILVSVFNKNGLQIKFILPDPTAVPTLSIQAKFMNNSQIAFNNFNFQVSLPKSMTFQMSPISTTSLLPFQQVPATQNLSINNPGKEILRIRFKVDYNANGLLISEMGDYIATS